MGRLSAHLIKIPEGSRINPHIDRHPEIRVNLELVRPSVGGQFYCARDAHLFRCGRLIVYKPHKVSHATWTAYSGGGLILTLGWATKKP